MGFLSKAWKGVKKVFKKVGKGIKKVASKVWGAAQKFTKSVTKKIGLGKVWDATSKVGKKAQAAFGKFANKIGPIGMIALSFVLGPAIGALWGMVGQAAGTAWSAFGSTMSGMMIQGSNALIQALGTAGTAIFNGVNFVGSTLGAMGSAFSEGASQAMAGEFGAAGNAFMDNMGAAFSGEAGSATMSQMAADAAAAAGNSALAAENVAALSSLGTSGQQAFANLAPDTLTTAGLEVATPEALAGLTDAGVSLHSPVESLNPDFTQLPNAGPTSPVAQITPEALGGPSAAELATQVDQFGMTVDQLNVTEGGAGAFLSSGKEGVGNIVSNARVVNPSNLDSDKTKKAIKSLLGKPGSGGTAQNNEGSFFQTGQAANLANWSEADWLRYQQVQRQQFNLI